MRSSRTLAAMQLLASRLDAWRAAHGSLAALAGKDVVAELQVYEGQSHAQYMRDANAPETKEAFEEIAKFFNKYLGK